ncbi:hypothetical protein V5O48_011935 [Marasmius crinis-equi]|uniref:Uncharacterized protein n=1 Tax=Marasmius crinis-equi TaxID=585013 RepID=A0ABR3F4N1_9AGAR
MAPFPVHPVDIQLPLPLTPTHDSYDTKTRRRSSTFTAITNWASLVQPGTPAPLSPVKRRRPSLHRRIASSSTSPSFLLTPTAAKPVTPNVDLTTLGYTSIFVRLPVTPETPSPFRSREPVFPEVPAKSGKGLKKIKSMGILRRNRAKSVVGDATGTSSTTSTTTSRPRPRSRSRSGSISPTKPTLKRPGHVKSKSVSATTPTKSRSRANKTHPPLPPALQNELLLMQFTGGGTLEANAQKLMKERSKAHGAGPAAVDTVYRDENGVMWLDEEERVEYQSLIPNNPPSSPPASPWVQFSASKALAPASPAIGAIQADEDPVRRGSLASLSPTERELEGAAAALVRPASPSAYIDAGVDVFSLSTPSSSADRLERRKRRRPAPLKLHSSSSVPTRAQQGFEDSFEPSSAEAAALAAGMYSHTHRRAAASRRASIVHVGSAPADVVSFDAVARGKGRKMNLAKRAKALFGLE